MNGPARDVVVSFVTFLGGGVTLIHMVYKALNTERKVTMWIVTYPPHL